MSLNLRGARRGQAPWSRQGCALKERRSPKVFFPFASLCIGFRMQTVDGFAIWSVWLRYLVSVPILAERTLQIFSFLVQNHHFEHLGVPCKMFTLEIREARLLVNNGKINDPWGEITHQGNPSRLTVSGQSGPGPSTEETGAHQSIRGRETDQYF